MDKTMTNAKELEQRIQIESLTARPISVPEDIPAMLELFHIVNEEDKIEERNNLDALTNHYENLRNCELATDSLILEVDGKLISTGRVWWAEEADGPLIYSTWAAVHPEWRRKGIGEQIQIWFEERAKEISEGHDPEKQKMIDMWAQDTQKGNYALADNFGYKEERYFFEMTRDLSKPIPEPIMPENLEVRLVVEENYRAIWLAIDEAFKDHWGYVPHEEKDYERWLNRINSLPEYDPNLWKVAWDGDQVAGMVLNAVFEEENRLLDQKKGWTDPICVRRPWRKKGLATALINESMQLLKDMGMELSALGVDTKNLSGALNLYTNCGYESGYTWVVFRKPLN